LLRKEQKTLGGYFILPHPVNAFYRILGLILKVTTANNGLCVTQALSSKPYVYWLSH